jgi:translation elongation factor aEF-1 beta
VQLQWGHDGEINMARVVATIKIFPSDVSVNLENLKRDVMKSLPSDASVYRFDEEPIAFGLIALIAHIIIPEEKSGELDLIETGIRKISDVSEVEVVMVRRI